MTEAAVCVACSHKIDGAAKLCPYCGANPETGEKIDTQSLLREEFHLHGTRSSASVIEFARNRQGIVIAVGAILALLILGALHQYVTMRNAKEVTAGPAVPLTDITDLSNQNAQAQQLPMPDLRFQYDGNPRAMRTYIVEPGAVTPPEVIAAQQAAAQQAAAAKAQQQPAPAAAGKPVPPNAPSRPTQR